MHGERKDTLEMDLRKTVKDPVFRVKEKEHIAVM
jgi:hypothetical protein